MGGGVCGSQASESELLMEGEEVTDVAESDPSAGRGKHELRSETQGIGDRSSHSRDTATSRPAVRASRRMEARDKLEANDCDESESAENLSESGRGGGPGAGPAESATDSLELRVRLWRRVRSCKDSSVVPVGRPSSPLSMENSGTLAERLRRHQTRRARDPRGRTETMIGTRTRTRMCGGMALVTVVNTRRM